MPENPIDKGYLAWRLNQKSTPDVDPSLLHTPESKYDTGFIIPDTNKETDPYTELADFKGVHQPTIDKLGNG